MCGGGGPSGKTEFEWNDTMKPYWGGWLAESQRSAQKPYQEYEGQRIAPFALDQMQAMNGIRNFSGSGGSPVTQAANGFLQQTLQGDHLNSNPMALDPNGGQWQAGINPWQNSSAVVTENQYKGDNPYFRQTLQTGMEDITNAYQQGTSADTTRMFNLAGAFGGSAHEKAVANNENALAKNLGNYANSMLQGQIDRSAGLEEAHVGRQLQNQQLDKQLGGQWYDNSQNRTFQGFEGASNRQMQAVQGGQNEQALFFDRMQKLMASGDAQRGLAQDYLNLDFGDWQQQQNHPYQMADWMTGILSRAQGGMSPNSSFSQSGYSASPFSSLLGAGLAAYGLSRG